MGAEPLHQHRRSNLVIGVDVRVAPALRAQQCSQLALSQIVPRTADLQYSLATVRHLGFRHKGFGASGQRPADKQVPLGREIGYDARKPGEPHLARSTLRQRPEPDMFGDFHNTVLTTSFHSINFPSGWGVLSFKLICRLVSRGYLQGSRIL